MTIKDKKISRWNPNTIAVHGKEMRSHFDETSEALFLTSGYIYKSAEEAEAAFKQEIDRYVYSRFGNPTVSMFEERLASLEKAEDCRAVSTGMAAVFAALASYLNAGDRLIASKALFGSCHYICKELLPRLGIITDFVDGTDIESWKELLSKPAKAVFLETPSNPGLEIIDLRSISELAHQAGALVFVDNVFSSPVLQKPLELGADVVIYSATKHIDGQGRCLGGAILGSVQFIREFVSPFVRHTGPALSPFNAWVLLKGIETLSLRINKHCDSALKISNHLEKKSIISKLLYPELKSHPQQKLAMQQMQKGGTVVSFEISGSQKNAFNFLNKLKLIKISNNLGDTKSLICHPYTTTHQRLTEQEKYELGITPNFLRLSVGLEDVTDIIWDLDQALK